MSKQVEGSKFESFPGQQGSGAFPRRTILMWLGVVLTAGIVAVFLATGFLSELARQRALNTILGEAVRNGPEGPPAESSWVLLSPPLRLAVAPVISPETSLLLYDDLAQYLGRRLGRPAELLLKADYSRTNELLKGGACDIALICTYAYIRAAAEANVEAIAMPVIGGEVTYHSLLVVRDDSPYHSLADLKGRRFASADEMSTTGWLYPAMLLLDLGEDPPSFFGELVLTGSHDRSLAAVVEGYADGAAVHSLVFQRASKQLRERVRIMGRSPAYGMPPVVVPPTVSDLLRTQLQEALLNAHEDPAGKEILESLDIDRFVVPPPGHYDSVKALVERWEGR